MTGSLLSNNLGFCKLNPFVKGLRCQDRCVVWSSPSHHHCKFWVYSTDIQAAREEEMEVGHVGDGWSSRIFTTRDASFPLTWLASPKYCALILYLSRTFSASHWGFMGSFSPWAHPLRARGLCFLVHHGHPSSSPIGKPMAGWLW